MNQELLYLFTAERIPGRILSEHVAILLGFEKYEIPILVAGKFLKPLGSPNANSTKWFSSSEIIRLANDTEFLSKATAYLQKKWRAKNQAAREKVLRDGLVKNNQNKKEIAA